MGVRNAIVLLVAASCGGLDAYNLTPLDGDTDALLAPLRIDAVEPAWGTPDGGTEVTILGAGFEGDVAVQFGRADVEVTRLGPGTLVVTSPFAGVEASVDLTVTSELGQVVLENAFTYADDQPPDTGDTGDTSDTSDTSDTGGDPKPTGLTGGFTQYTRTQIACPDCFGLTEELNVEGLAVFHDPTNQGWLRWMPPSGSCTMNPDAVGPSVRFHDVGPWTYLQSASSNVPLRKTSTVDGPLYEASGLPPEQWLSNAAYDIAVTDGGELGKPFSVTGALRTPQGFTSIQPAEMLYTDPTYAFSAYIDPYDATFQWSPSGGGGSFVIVVDVYDGYDSRYLGQVYCHGADNGRMTLPSSALTGFPPFSLLAIGMYRTWMAEGVIPPNGATMETLAQSGVLGTGLLIP